MRLQHGISGLFYFRGGMIADWHGPGNVCTVGMYFLAQWFSGDLNEANLFWVRGRGGGGGVGGLESAVDGYRIRMPTLDYQVVGSSKEKSAVSPCGFNSRTYLKLSVGEDRTPDILIPGPAETLSKTP